MDRRDVDMREVSAEWAARKAKREAAQKELVEHATSLRRLVLVEVPFTREAWEACWDVLANLVKGMDVVILRSLRDYFRTYSGGALMTYQTQLDSLKFTCGVSMLQLQGVVRLVVPENETRGDIDQRTPTDIIYAGLSPEEVKRVQAKFQKLFQPAPAE